jgi:hypothetical protein
MKRPRSHPMARLAGRSTRLFVPPPLIPTLSTLRNIPSMYSSPHQHGALHRPSHIVHLHLLHQSHLCNGAKPPADWQSATADGMETHGTKPRSEEESKARARIGVAPRGVEHNI